MVNMNEMESLRRRVFDQLSVQNSNLNVIESPYFNFPCENIWLYQDYLILKNQKWYSIICWDRKLTQGQLSLFLTIEFESKQANIIPIFIFDRNYSDLQSLHNAFSQYDIYNHNILEIKTE